MSEADIQGSLWPKSLRPTVRSPAAIVNEQAEALTRVTGGKLRGEVTLQREVTEAGAKVTIHKVAIHLDVIAGSIDYRHRVLSVTHGMPLIYPAFVEAAYFKRDRVRMLAGALGVATRMGVREKQENEAASDIELIKLIEAALGWTETEALLLSLIALEGDSADKENHLLDGAQIGDPIAEPPSKPTEKPDSADQGQP